jgi:hypothetical protein
MFWEGAEPLVKSIKNDHQLLLDPLTASVSDLAKSESPKEVCIIIFAQRKKF